MLNGYEFPQLASFFEFKKYPAVFLLASNSVYTLDQTIDESLLTKFTNKKYSLFQKVGEIPEKKPFWRYYELLVANNISILLENVSKTLIETRSNNPIAYFLFLVALMSIYVYFSK